MARSQWISDLHWVRPGQQSRSQKTQAALLDAAQTLFCERGVDSTSVADVAERAGCSVGAVYHHFRDKITMLYALVDRMTMETRAMTKEAVNPERWEGARIVDLLLAYLQLSLELGREHASFKRAMLEASRNNPDILQHLTELSRELDKGLEMLILARKSEIGHPDPATATAFVIDKLGAMLWERLEKSPRPTMLASRSDQVFIQEAVRSCCAYLQIELPG